MTDPTGHARHRGAQSQTTQIIMEAARQPGGITYAAAAALCGWPIEEASSRLSLMVRRGRLFRGAVQGHRIRLFASQAAALEWVQGAEPIVPPAPVAARQKVLGRGRLGDAARRLLDMAALPGGLTAVSAVPALQALGLTANTSTAAARLDALARHGHLVRAVAPGQRNRYFTTDEAATAWLAQFGPPVLDAGAGSNATPKRAASIACEVIVPASVRVQVVPHRADLRWCVPPGQAVEGIGAVAEWERLRGEGSQA